MENKTKILIATPMYGGFCTGFYLQCILQTQAVFNANKVESMMSFVFNESLITRARNALAHNFLKTDCTHLLFIDADIAWNGNDLIPMILSNKDVICGIYPKKEINWQTVSNAVKDGVPVEQLKTHTGAWVINLVDYKGEVTVPAGEPLEVWAGGTGMMLIKREVFEKLKDAVPKYKNDVTDLSGNTKPGEEIAEYFATSIEPETNRLLSEDYHFCRAWRQTGGKIYAAPWMNLGHMGSYLFEGQLARSE
jgi:hypothetical protein